MAKRPKRRRQNPKKPPAPKLVKTKLGVPTIGLGNLDIIASQERAMINAFIEFSGSELFQYSNKNSIDGIFSDVSIMNVLSDRRRQYQTNDIINIYPTWLVDVTRDYGTGNPNESGSLIIEIDDEIESGEIELLFFINNTLVSEIGSEEYI